MTLLERVEAATKREEYAVLFYVLALAGHEGWIGEDAYRVGLAWVKADAYTDAALLLIPEGCAWRVSQRLDNLGPSCTLQRRDHSGEGFDIWLDVDGKTPALAIVAAAQRAREAENEGTK